MHKWSAPEERAFRISDLPAYLRANRERLVVAALTILRAYHIAGRPGQNVRPWGGFDHWSRAIREPLIWLGVADPCQTRDRVIANDPDRDRSLNLLSAWHSAFGERAMLVAEVISEAGRELRESLLMVAAADRTDPTRVDPRRLGAWCRSIEDRIFGEFRLSRTGSVRRAARWKVSCVSSVSSKAADQNGATHTERSGDGTAAESVRASSARERADVNSPNSPNSHNAADEEGPIA